MLNILLLGLASVVCLGYSYLCFFRKDKVAWTVTSPISGNFYSEFLTLHAVISLVIGLVSLIFLLSKLFHWSA